MVGGIHQLLIIFPDDPIQKPFNSIPKEPPDGEGHKEESQKPLQDQAPDSRIQIGKSVSGLEGKGKSHNPKKVFEEVLRDSLPGEIDYRHPKHLNRSQGKERFASRGDKNIHLPKVKYHGRKH
jgi:hypothetical protein